MPDPLLPVEIQPEVCTVPEGALTANDVLAAAVLSTQVGGGSRTTALRAFAFALDVTLPVTRGAVTYCGVIPGETGSVEGDRRRAVHNHQAMQRLVELVSEHGGGRVRVRDLRFDTLAPTPEVPWQSNRKPVLWLGPLGITEGVETAHGEAGPPDVVEVGKPKWTTGDVTVDRGVFGTSPELDAADQTAVLHVEPSDGLTRVAPNVASTVTFEVRAERYDRFAGDVVFTATVPTNGSAGPHTVVYPDGRALAALPTVWQAVRLDTGVVLQSVPRPNGNGFNVTFASAADLPAGVLVQFTARVG